LSKQIENASMITLILSIFFYKYKEPLEVQTASGSLQDRKPGLGRVEVGSRLICALRK
jgi:hypothetical protein